MKCFFNAARIELDENETRAFKANLEFRFLVFKVASDMANHSGRAIKVIGSSGNKYPVNSEDEFENFNTVVKSNPTLVKAH